MDNIVESYLMFKANNVCDNIEVLAKELRVFSKVPKQLNKLVYKYYDLFVLSSKEFDQEFFRNKTGLNETKIRQILFYLLIEFDFASKTEYQDKEYYEFYDFLVNAIILFTLLESIKIKYSNLSYDDAILKAVNSEDIVIDTSFALLLNNSHELLERHYNYSLKSEIKFWEEFVTPMYQPRYRKVRNSNNLYLEKLNYKNDKLLKESRKDVELIDTQYQFELSMVSINIVSMDIIRGVLCGIDKRVMIHLPDEVITKKNNLEVLLDMMELRFLKEKIIFCVNTSLLEKYEDRISSLMDSGFNISFYKDCILTSNDLFKEDIYLILDNSDVKDNLKFAYQNNLKIIVNKMSKENIEVYKDMMYVT